MTDLRHSAAKAETALMVTRHFKSWIYRGDQDLSSTRCSCPCVEPADPTNLIHVSASCMDCGQRTCRHGSPAQRSQGRNGLDGDEAFS